MREMRQHSTSMNHTQVHTILNTTRLDAEDTWAVARVTRLQSSPTV